MKTRTAIGGGVIALAVVAGAYLGGIIPKFGTGSGFGLGNGSGTGSDAPPNLKGVVADTSSHKAPDQKAAARPVEDSKVLMVRIDGHDYEVAEGMTDGEPQFYAASLAAIVESATKSDGNDQGIRVRVTRLSSAKAAAEIRLKDELIKAGLTPESIDWGAGPAP